MAQRSALDMGLTNEFITSGWGSASCWMENSGIRSSPSFELVCYPHGKLKSTLPGRANGLTVHGVDQNGNPFTNTWC